MFRDLANPARGETVAIVHPGTRVLPKDVQAPSIEMSKPPVPTVNEAKQNVKQKTKIARVGL